MEIFSRVTTVIVYGYLKTVEWVETHPHWTLWTFWGCISLIVLAALL
jgi:uncharacterized membrane protein